MAKSVIEGKVGMRLNKFVAQCGVCSRRKAAELVKNGEIKVNGQIEVNPGYVTVPKDKVYYLGKRLHLEIKKVYILMNKPKNVVTTVSDEKGRKTVMDIVEKKVKLRVYPVGRLDRNTTGLLLITNDGDLTKKLSHPSHKVKKIYNVELDRKLTEKDLKKLAKGLDLFDGKAIVDKVGFIPDKPKNLVSIELHSGRNRIIRRIFEALDYEVVRLDRIYYAGLTKKDLPRGWFRDLKKQEIIMLKHFV